MKKIGVIGLGNPLRRDDGIGIVLLELVRKNKEGFPRHIEFVDGGTGGLRLLHLLARYDIVLIIDAVDFKGRPGDVRLFQKEDIQRSNAKHQLSTHEPDFFQVIRLSKELKELPSRLIFFGVQPKKLSYEAGLSTELQTALPLLYQRLISEIQDFTK